MAGNLLGLHAQLAEYVRSRKIFIFGKIFSFHETVSASMTKEERKEGIGEFRTVGITFWPRNRQNM